MKDLRYGFIFEFQDGGWNIIMFDENGEYHKYYTCDEDDYDDAITHLEDYVSNPSMIRRYIIPTYDMFCEVIDEEIYELPNEDIEILEMYRK